MELGGDFGWAAVAVVNQDAIELGLFEGPLDVSAAIDQLDRAFQAGGLVIELNQEPQAAGIDVRGILEIKNEEAITFIDQGTDLAAIMVGAQGIQIAQRMDNQGS